MLNAFRIEEVNGVSFLDSMSRKSGDEPFLETMPDYFAANGTKTVSAQSFLAAAGVQFAVPDPGDGPAYLPEDIRRGSSHPRSCTGPCATRFRDQIQREAVIYKDFEVADALLAHREAVFVGRPETNSALAAWLGRSDSITSRPSSG